MRGGSGLLPDALGESLGPIVRLSTTVTSMSLDGAGVRIAYAGPDGAGEIRARTAIVAVPAPLLPGVLGDAITPEIRSALGDVTFGPMAVLSIRTDETTPMPWDDLYSVLTPDLRFNMFFNHANFMHGVGQKQGSVIMVYGGGRRARALLGASEDAVRDTFLADLDLMYPQVRRHIAETWVKEEARLLGTDDERVRNGARAEHERAGARRDRRALDPDRELAIEDVEPLVLVVVDVQRRAAAAGHKLLGHHHATAGLGAVGLDGREAPEEPEVLSLAGPVGDGCEGVLRRAHRCASVVDRLHACSMSAVTRSHHPRTRGDFGCAL